jgi:hypothetical protein
MFVFDFHILLQKELYEKTPLDSPEATKIETEIREMLFSLKQ